MDHLHSSLVLTSIKHGLSKLKHLSRVHTTKRKAEISSNLTMDQKKKFELY